MDGVLRNDQILNCTIKIVKHEIISSKWTFKDIVKAVIMNTSGTLSFTSTGISIVAYPRFCGAKLRGRNLRVTFLSDINIKMHLGLLAQTLSLFLTHMFQGY